MHYVIIKQKSLQKRFFTGGSHMTFFTAHWAVWHLFAKICFTALHQKRIFPNNNAMA